MRLLHRRVRVLGGAVAVLLASVAVALTAGSSGAERSPARSAAAEKSALGSVTALTWKVQTPVGARLVLRPYVKFHLTSQALRARAAAKPRLTGSFVARIATARARGRSRTLVVVSRRRKNVALGTSTASSILGKDVRLRRWVLTREQTRAVKRAAARGPLALTLSARYSVSYTNARGRKVVTPTHSRSVTSLMALKPTKARGRNLHELAATFRDLLGRAGQMNTACVTRNEILRGLRSAYTAMVSGDRTGARMLLQQAHYAYAEVMPSAGLITRQQASALGSGLGALISRVGSGRSERIARAPRWPALRDCAPTPNLGSAGAPTPRPKVTGAGGGPGYEVVLIPPKPGIIKSVRRLMKNVRDWFGHSDRKWGDKIISWAGGGVVGAATGIGVYGLNKVIWNNDSSSDGSDPPPNAYAEVPEGDPTGAALVLDDLKLRMENFTTWEQTFIFTKPSEVQSSWISLLDVFERNRWHFQPTTPYYTLSDQVELLPAFADYINAYLTVLREGVENGYRWGLTPDTIASLEDKIRGELDPTKPSTGCTTTCPGGNNGWSYGQRIYDEGLATLGSSTDAQKDFALTNGYKAYMQVTFHDLRDAWHLQDPMRYPFGDASFNQDRIVYSDAVGETDHAFSPPPNPPSPLTALTAWTTRVDWGDHNNQNWLTAIQADNSPQVGARTGATSTGTPTTYDVAPGSALGPVVQVDATWDQKSPTFYPQKLVDTLRFHFSKDGSVATPGGDFYDRGSPYTTTEAVDGEVLAAIKVMGSYQMSDTKDVGDSLVYGWRFADSFSPEQKGSLPGARRAANNTEACLGVEQVTITSGTHAGTTTGSRTNGAPLQMRPCSSTAWDQNWQYVDYNIPDDTSDDAAQQELTVYAGNQCMAPKTGADGNWATGGGYPTASSTTWPPPPHTLVGSYDCTGTNAQKWTVNADGTIRPRDADNLCLDRWNGATASGTPIQLYSCSAGTAQRWTRP